MPRQSQSKTNFRATETALVSLGTLSPPSPYSARQVAIRLALFMAFAVALSLVFFLNQSLRLDESQSIWQTSRSVPAILDTVSHDVHVPLYHLLLHFWETLFGMSVAAVRTLSLIFFIAAIPAIYILGRYAYNQSIGLYAAGITALSPFLNWYGNETRMYSLVALLSILSSYFFLRIYRGDRSRSAWIGYAVAALLGIYTHYFFFFILVTQALFYFMNRKHFPELALRKFIFVALLCALAIAPWLDYVKRSGGFSLASPAIPRPKSIDIFNAFSQFVFGFQTDALNTIIVAAWPLVMVLAFLALQSGNRFPKESIYFFLQTMIPILLVFAVSIFVTPLFLSRYLIMCAPAFYLFLAWIFSTYPRAIAKTVRTSLAFGMAAGLMIQIAGAQTPVKENYEQAADYLTAHANSADTIIVSAPFTIYPVDYYYKGPDAISTLPLWNNYAYGPIPPFTSSTLPAQVPAILGDHARVWLLLSYNQGYEDAVRSYFQSHYQELDHRNFSKDLDLYLFRVRYDIPTDGIAGIPPETPLSPSTSTSTASSSPISLGSR